MTSYTNKGVNVCANDMRATERMNVRTYVCTSERTCERACERPSVRLHGHSPRARERTYKSILFLLTQPFFTFLVGTFARTEIRSNKVDFVCARGQ